MSTYHDLIYGGGNPSYDEKLCSYLVDRFRLYGRLLDVGCGTGSHMKSFSRCGLNCGGIDRDVICVSERNYFNAKEHVFDIEKDRFIYKDDYFSCIFSKSLLEHILRPDNMMEECYRILKPGGTIILMTPDWLSQRDHFWDDYSHVHAFTRKSIRDMLTIFGFKNADCEYFYQLPFIWKYPWLKFIPKIISILPQSFKWKDDSMRNGRDNKLIRFSKEQMLLAYATK